MAKRSFYPRSNCLNVHSMRNSCAQSSRTTITICIEQVFNRPPKQTVRARKRPASLGPQMSLTTWNRPDAFTRSYEAGISAATYAIKQWNGRHFGGCCRATPLISLLRRVSAHVCRDIVVSDAVVNTRVRIIVEVLAVAPLIARGTDV